MNSTDILGYTAAALGTSLMIPQIVRIIRTKHAGDVSIVMLIVYVVQCALWAWYSWLIGAMPMIVCNVVAFAIGIVLLFLKKKYTPRTPNAF
jgi:MtN3 and saliva related transmembrane protein